MAEELSNWNPKTRYYWPCKILLQKSQVGPGELGVRYTFEAFPNQYIVKGGVCQNPVDAEESCWKAYQEFLPRMCKYDHNNPLNIEKRDYTNGCGFCVHCKKFCTDVHQPDEKCVNCGVPTFWISKKDDSGKRIFWCENCAYLKDKEVLDD